MSCDYLSTCKVVTIEMLTDQEKCGSFCRTQEHVVVARASVYQKVGRPALEQMLTKGPPKRSASGRLRRK
jgi:hypothetical protein